MTDDLPNSLLIPTNDPSETAREYAKIGYRWEQLFVSRFNPKICQRHLYAVRLWRPLPEQKELI